jgi:hypothetical protein
MLEHPLLAENSPMRSARSKSGGIRTWRSSARGADRARRDAPVVGARVVGPHGTEARPSRELHTARPIIDPGHGRRLLAFRRTRMALRPIACNAADPYPLGDEPYPPKGALPPRR